MVTARFKTKVARHWTYPSSFKVCCHLIDVPECRRNGNWVKLGVEICHREMMILSVWLKQLLKQVLETVLGTKTVAMN